MVRDVRIPARAETADIRVRATGIVNSAASAIDRPDLYIQHV